MAEESKNIQLVIERDGKKFFMVFPEGTTAQEAYAACYDFIAQIIRIADETKRSQEKTETK